jgi:hypothetical protein
VNEVVVKKILSMTVLKQRRLGFDYPADQKIGRLPELKIQKWTLNPSIKFGSKRPAATPKRMFMKMEGRGKCERPAGREAVAKTQL